MQSKTDIAADSFHPVRLQPARRIPSLADDARDGLLSTPRTLPPKYFYDERGSVLFDRICQTPEYYPTRSEAVLLDQHAAEIIRRCRPGSILELGSGTSAKTRLLLQTWAEQSGGGRYWPFDVSEEMLLDAAASINHDFPQIAVTPLVGDYTGGLQGLPAMAEPNLTIFLGGTIGNFTHHEAVSFLSELADRMALEDHVLIGMDRHKDTGIIEAAYNDAEGLTALFNLNVLNVLNRELGADFDVEKFRHQAVYNVDGMRIEMYLIARQSMKVSLPALSTQFEMEEGERILTEISRKFDDKSAKALLVESGLELVQPFLSDNGYFSLVLARRRR